MFVSTRRVFSAATLAVSLLLVPALRAAGGPENATAILGEAKAAAKAEHKNILLVFSASWCGPCHLYEKFLADPAMKPLMEKAFIIETLDVGEKSTDTKHADTPGAVKLRDSLAGPEPGYPYIGMLTADGKLITDSLRPVKGSKENIGYPYEPEEIDWYMQMMKRAAPTLSPAELGQMEAWLRSHGRK